MMLCIEVIRRQNSYEVNLYERGDLGGARRRNFSAASIILIDKIDLNDFILLIMNVLEKLIIFHLVMWW